MRKKTLLALICACTGFAVLGVGQASAATLITGVTAFQAIYGNPPAATPAGFGLARNFGFGANMLFRANEVRGLGKNVKMTFKNYNFTTGDLYIGATLMSNKTAEGTPLGATIQFADFQNVVQTVEGKKEPIQKFSDTNDRPWITTICAPGLSKCQVDPLFLGERSVKIEDVSINLGPGFVTQGTVWGRWENGTTKTPPCIVFELPPVAAAGDQTLIVTQTFGAYPPVGTKLTEISGEMCLISANNYYYEGNAPEIRINP
jgi:hypothetical protein